MTTQNPDIPVLAISVVKSRMAAARDAIATGYVEAVGYRLMVLPLEAEKGLEAAEAQQFKTLGEKGFEVKTEHQKDRESKGSFHGVVISAGPECYNNPNLAKQGPWIKEGDVVLFARYAGERIEHPPGSNTWYQFMNDEDILGKIVQ